jgi:hypothetical protein
MVLIQQKALSQTAPIRRTNQLQCGIIFETNIMMTGYVRRRTLGSNPILQPYAVLHYRREKVLQLELLEEKISAAAAHNLLL